MGRFKNELLRIEKDLGLRVFRNLERAWGGVSNDEAFDCFCVAAVDEWAERNCDPNAGNYTWDVVDERIYFTIKSMNTPRQRAQPGFQINVYSMDPELGERVENIMIGKVKELLGPGESVGENGQRRFFQWVYPEDGIPFNKIMDEVIPAIIECVKDK